MTYDGESGVSIDYNYLNRPRKITRNGGILVKYSYLADGSKASAEVFISLRTGVGVMPCSAL